jgi:hypothetical protein
MKLRLVDVSERFSEQSIRDGVQQSRLAGSILTNDESSTVLIEVNFGPLIPGT